MAGFVARPDRIDALADRTSASLLEDSSGNGTGLRPFDDPMIIVGVDHGRRALRFRPSNPHSAVMRARKAWFEKPTRACAALMATVLALARQQRVRRPHRVRRAQGSACGRAAP